MDKLELFIKEALNEDIRSGDLFHCMLGSKWINAVILCKEDGVLSGVTYINTLAKMQNIKVKFNFKDGDNISKGDILAEIEGSCQDILTSERVILNILQHSSGIATKTKQMVSILAGTKIKLLDTRKTRPRLRLLEKYSVRNGGGYNHRMGLYDSLMLKDTHLAGIDNITEFLIQARKQIPWTSKIEVECETLTQAKYMLNNDIDIIMCDNMSTEDIAKVVEYKKENNINILIECSGNMDEDRLNELKKIEIDAISVGSIIHQAVWLDFSMKVR